MKNKALGIDMRMIDHGIKGALVYLVYCGALRSMIAVSMDDDCIRRCWRENVPVVGEDSLQRGLSLGTSLLCRNANGRISKRTANTRQREKQQKKRPYLGREGCSMQEIIVKSTLGK